MSEISDKVRYILQYYYDKGENAARAREKICAVYGEETISESAARKWFVRFRSGNFDVKDVRRSGRPITVKVDKIFQKIHENRHIGTRVIAKELNINQKTVLNHLHKAGYKKHVDVWVRHDEKVDGIKKICKSSK